MTATACPETGSRDEVISEAEIHIIQIYSIFYDDEKPRLVCTCSVVSRYRGEGRVHLRRRRDVYAFNDAVQITSSVLSVGETIFNDRVSLCVLIIPCFLCAAQSQETAHTSEATQQR